MRVPTPFFPARRTAGVPSSPSEPLSLRAGIVARLSSAGFTEKAPKNVVDKARGCLDNRHCEALPFSPRRW